MINPGHPLAVLIARVPWDQVDSHVAPFVKSTARIGRLSHVARLFRTFNWVLNGAGGVFAQRLGGLLLKICLMIRLMYLKRACAVSDGSQVRRWPRDMYFQCIISQSYFQLRQLCDTRLINRLRKDMDEADIGALPKALIHTAVTQRALKKIDLQRCIVESAVLEKSIAQSTGSRLLGGGRNKLVCLGQRCGIDLKQTCDKECALLLRCADRDAQAKKFKSQRIALGVLSCEVQPKVSIAAAHWYGLVVAARSLAGNPVDSLTLTTQVDETSILLQGHGVEPHAAMVDLADRRVDVNNQVATIIRRPGYRSLTNQPHRWLNRREPKEPVIGCSKDDDGMRRCWVKSHTGGTLNAVVIAAGFNTRWLMRAI